MLSNLMIAVNCKKFKTVAYIGIHQGSVKSCGVQKRKDIFPNFLFLGGVDTLIPHAYDSNSAMFSRRRSQKYTNNPQLQPGKNRLQRPASHNYIPFYKSSTITSYPNIFYTSYQMQSVTNIFSNKFIVH